MVNKTFLFSILFILFISIGSACAVSIDNENVSSNNGILINEDNTSESEVLLNSQIQSSDDLNKFSEVSILDDGDKLDSNLEHVGASESNVSSEINVPKYSAGNSLENSNDSSLGVALFTNDSNLVSVSATTTSTSSFTISQITTAANTLKSYVLANKTLPTTITVGGVKISIEQFSYLMSVAIKNINEKNTSKISLSKVTVSNPSGSTINETLSLSNYTSVVNTIISFVNSNKRLPNYTTINNIKAEFKVYTYAFAKILAFYKSNSRLPNTCTFESGVFKTTNSTSNSSTNLGSFTIASIVSAAVNVKSYVVTNKVLPSTVTVGSSKLSIAQFSYLMSVAVKYLKAGKKTSTKITAVNVSKGSASGVTLNKTLTLDNCVSLANSVYSSVSSKKVVPGYVTFSGSKYDFNLYTYGFAKILAFYKSNNRLPTSCTFKSSDFKSTSLGSFTIASIVSAAVNVKSYVVTNKVLPSTVTVGSSKLSIAQFSYLMSVAVKYLKAGKKTSTKITAVDVTNGSASGVTISKTLTLDNCVSLANSVYSSVSSKKVVPGYVTFSGSKYDFNLYTYGFAKILAFYKSNNRLPTSCTFKSSDFKSSTPIISGITYKKGINEKETLTDLSAYLKSGGHAVITTDIKNLATSLTKNCKNTLEKANAIFKYVRDEVTYSYYANSQKDASGALSSKKANCCDKSNLIVALCRAAGIAAKYTHGKSCVFSSGLNTGHVWAQIYVDGIWYAADATSTKNSLGFINNWNTNSFTLSGQYINLPF